MKLAKLIVKDGFKRNESSRNILPQFPHSFVVHFIASIWATKVLASVDIVETLTTLRS